MPFAVSRLLAFEERWCLKAMLSTPEHPPVVLQRIRAGCCGECRLIGAGYVIPIPSLAWIEGDPATDERLHFRAPTGMLATLARIPEV